MDNFILYFTLGLQHILNVGAVDHLLFIAALCIRYQLNNWKNVFILITAFTVGHSFTLAISTLQLLEIPSNSIEFLIPCTIFVTALGNVFVRRQQNVDTITSIKRPFLLYTITVIFGCIHGLGFSNYLKSIVGKQQSILVELLSFNIGLEIGQLIPVVVILLVSRLIAQLLQQFYDAYYYTINGAIIALAIEMMLQRH